ncbi:MAG TPA: type VI secretion system-associated FHA domain protein TagH [Gammaproteobacteria bacterium]
MALRLRVVGRNAQKLGPRSVKEFGRKGGTIGRSLDCDWVLPDGQRYVSSRHASIDFRSGSYYIVDTSTNGVYVNGADQPVGRGKPQRLFNGDRIRLGEYEIRVEVEDESEPLDERHIDPVDLAQRVEAPEPVGEDLVDAYEITGVGMEMFLSDEEIESLTPPSRNAGFELELEPSEGDDMTRTRPHIQRKAPRPAAPASAPAKAGAASAAEPADTVRASVKRAEATASGSATSATGLHRVPPRAAAKTIDPGQSAKIAMPRPRSAAAGEAGRPARRPAAVAPNGPAAPAAPARMSTAATARTRSAPAASARPAAPQQPPTATFTGRIPARITNGSGASSGPSSAPLSPRPATASSRSAPPRPAAAGKPGAAVASVDAARAVKTLEPFFVGAGLEPLPVDAQQADAILRRAGRLLREMVVGIAESLEVRAEQKRMLKLPTTPTEPQDDNPLKFSEGVEEMLLNLLLLDSDEYVAPVDAIRNVFADEKRHQQRLLKALHESLEVFVARLAPEELEQKFVRGKPGRLMSAANKLKYWDFYKDLYDVVMHHPPGELPAQFVDDFAHAYEQTIESPPGPEHGAAPKAQAS